MTDDCLSREDLGALLEERLAEPESTAIAAHFRTCDVCQRAADGVFATFRVDRIPHQASAIDEDPADLHSFLQQLKQLPPDEFKSWVPSEAETLANSRAVVEGDRSDADSVVDHSDPWLGRKIGPYRLIERLGQGGFGIVYRAQQDQPIRLTVALKVIKPGMDSREVIYRFQTERQALALMDHPYIARVLNAGTTDDGRPYFVMELVNGLPLTDYCDHHRLTISQRLELLVTVCEAVQHAHQKGIIHRDLKPSNILVADRNGVSDVKVIDFGIAKALTPSLADRTAMTSAGQMIGTLLYMAPEQIGTAGIDVDTRCDVYSLGGLLFELLTGSTPFEGERLKTLDQWESLRIIREEEPPRPSARLTAHPDTVPSIAEHRATSPRDLLRRVRSDLDWIVLKALEKDRDRRYLTTSALAEDITRVLNHEPVDACPHSAMYRLRKFVRRNWLVLNVTAFVCLIFAAGASTSMWQAVRADREAHKSGAVLYAVQINRAHESLRNGDLDQAQILLQRCIPAAGKTDYRGLEWGLLTQQLRVPSEELMRLASPQQADGSQTQDVSCVRMSPDSTYLIAATDGGVIHRYSLQSAEELLPWETGLADVRRMAFSPNGRRLAVISYEAAIVIIDTTSGLVEYRFSSPKDFDHRANVVFWTDDRLIAFRHGNVLRTWDLSREAALYSWRIPSIRIIDLAMSRQPRRLAVLVEETAKSRAVRFFENLLQKDGLNPLLVAVDSTAIALSHDGHYLAVGSKSGEVTIWDHAAKVSLALLTRPEGIEELTFSEDDHHLALAERSGMVTVWQWHHPEESLLVSRGKIQRVVEENGVLTANVSEGPPIAITAELRVNALGTDGSAKNASPVAVDAHGNAVVTWSSKTSRSTWRVCAQRFGTSGEPLGGEIHVSEDAKNAQIYPDVAMDPDGNFVIVWEGRSTHDSDTAGVLAQRYNAAGQPQGVNFRVNSTVIGYQGIPNVAMGPNGASVVTWTSRDQDEPGESVYAKLYDASGNVVKDEFAVQVHSAGNQRQPCVAMNGQGDFVITWQSEDQDVSGQRVSARRFNARGEPLSDELTVTARAVGTQQAPSIAMDTNGAFVVTWMSADPGAGWDDSGDGIYARRFDADGMAQGKEFLVNTVTAHTQGFPSVAMAPHGDFVIVWESAEQDGSDYEIYAQRFGSNGEPDGKEFRVNQSTVGRQNAAAVAFDAEGNTLFTWASREQVFGKCEIHARHLRAEAERLAILNEAIASQADIRVVQDHHGRMNVEIDDRAAEGFVTGNDFYASDRPSLVHWQAHARPARSIVFGPDKGHVFTAGFDGRVTRWPWTRQKVRRLPTASYPLVWIPSRQAVAISHSTAVKLYDLHTGNVLANLPLPPGVEVQYLACDDQGRWIVGNTSPPALFLLKWDLQRLAITDPVAVPCEHIINVERFLPNSSLLITSRVSPALHLDCWNMETSQRRYEKVFVAEGVKLWGMSQNTPDLFLTKVDALQQFDASTGAELARRPFDALSYEALAVSPEGKLLAFSRLRRIELVDPATGKARPMAGGHSGRIQLLQFSPNGESLLALDNKGVLKFWEVAHGLELMTWHTTAPIRHFSLSPDGRWLALSYDKETEIVEISPIK